MIHEFKGPYRWLSNFAPVFVVLDSLTYPTVEHAYQAAKTLDPVARVRIAVADTPAEAKRLGQSIVPKRSLQGWDQRKVGVMRDLLIQKFSIPEYRDRLLATGDEQLQEGNTWGDTFWGVDLSTGEGQNHLGRLLMEIRANLRKAGRDGTGVQGGGRA